MDGKYTVAVLVGSLRKDSFNLKLAKALTGLAPGNLSFEFVNIDLPLYNPDREDNDLPDAWWNFRENIRAVDAILFVTPEYNRSIPASLKNALDVGSRPMGKSVWNGKPAAIVSCSPGGIGGFGANHILRQSLVFLNVPAKGRRAADLSCASSAHMAHKPADQFKNKLWLTTRKSPAARKNMGSRMGGDWPHQSSSIISVAWPKNWRRGGPPRWRAWTSKVFHRIEHFQ